MNLEERYYKADAGSYVGKVRAQQAAINSSGGDISDVKKGVNFMGGTTGLGNNPWQYDIEQPDQVQTEFTRNNPGDFRYNGGGKTPAATNAKTYSLSRWTALGVNKGDTYLANTRYTKISDVRNANKSIHNYNGLGDSGANTFAGKFAPAKNKIESAPAGRSPGGLNG